MRLFLAIGGVAFWFIGIVSFVTAKTAFVETTGAIFILNGTIAFIGAAIVEAVRAGPAPPKIKKPDFESGG